MIDNNPVMPTVCALAWMADAAENAFSGYHYQGLENYKLFKGVVFDGFEAKDYNIDLVIVDATDHDQLRLNAKISSQNNQGKTVFHYGAELIMRKYGAMENSEDAQLPDKILKKAISVPTDEASQLYDDGTLFHGESLQGIVEILLCDDKGLLMACQVPAIASDKQGDFPLTNQNIFANDLVYQSMLVWVRKQLAMGSLPSSTRHWTTYRQVNEGEGFYLQLTVVEQSSSKMIADILLIGTDDKILAKVKSAEVTVSESLNDLFCKSPELDTAKISGLH
jgi:hypothetical protein